jgi:pyridoxamine 5'-phosphate oxidase
MNISEIRKEYAKHSLDESSVKKNPFEQFKIWLDEALASELPEPTAMHITSVSPEGMPSGRMVLLKGFDYGFIFYTNYLSRKGRELSENPKTCLTFFWAELERQVRISGIAEKTASEESDKYFASRPLGSQIGAVISPQSQKIQSRDFLEKMLSDYEREFPYAPPQRPEHWGGFRVIPQSIEFWQGRPSRLHDRILYETDVSGNWHISRLAP